MKNIFCKQCGDLVCLRLNEIRTCHCGNIKGKYTNNFDIAISAEQGFSTMSIVGIDNNLLKNMYLPTYHGEKDMESETVFEQWGSAIVVIPPFTTNDVFELEG